jgi:hypothetical protein
MGKTISAIFKILLLIPIIPFYCLQISITMFYLIFGFPVIISYFTFYAMLSTFRTVMDLSFAKYQEFSLKLNKRIHGWYKCAENILIYGLEQAKLQMDPDSREAVEMEELADVLNSMAEESFTDSNTPHASAADRELMSFVHDSHVDLEPSLLSSVVDGTFYTGTGSFFVDEVECVGSLDNLACAIGPDDSASNPASDGDYEPCPDTNDAALSLFLLKKNIGAAA